MSLIGSATLARLTGTVYLVSTRTGAIKPIPLALYMSSRMTARKLAGWIAKMDKVGAIREARKYIRN